MSVILKSSILYIILLFLSSCRAIDNSQVDSQVIQSLDPWIVYTTRVIDTTSAREVSTILEGTNSYRPPEPQRGWKYVVIEMVFESTQNNGRFVKNSTRSFQVLDSSNTWREGEFYIYTCWRPGSNFFNYSLPEGLRIRAVGYVEIPEMMSVTSAKLELFDRSGLGYREKSNIQAYNIDVNNIRSDKYVFPVDIMPSSIPVFEDSIQLELSNMVITLHNPKINDGSFGSKHIEFDATVKNLTAQNISSDSQLRAITVDEWGIYCVSSSFLNFSSIPDGIIPPSYTETITAKVPLYSHQENFKQLYIVIGEEQNGGYSNQYINNFKFQFLMER